MEENTVVAGNPAKFIRNVEGPKMGRHFKKDLQEQREKMQQRMRKYADSNWNWYKSE